MKIVDFEAEFSHQRASNNLGNYENLPFITGSISSTGSSQTERLVKQNGILKWQLQDAYPTMSIHSAAIVSFHDRVVLFGGRGRLRDSQDEQDFDAVRQFSHEYWQSIGNMKRPRSFHNVISIGENVYIIGGSGTM